MEDFREKIRRDALKRIEIIWKTVEAIAKGDVWKFLKRFSLKTFQNFQNANFAATDSLVRLASDSKIIISYLQTDLVLVVGIERRDQIFFFGYFTLRDVGEDRMRLQHLVNVFLAVVQSACEREGGDAFGKVDDLGGRQFLCKASRRIRSGR